MLERKLVTFWSPNNWDKKKLCTIAYAYYKNGEWTRESEEASITEEELYKLIKPVLIFRKEKI